MLIDKLNLTEEIIEEYQELEHFINKASEYKNLEDKLKRTSAEINNLRRLTTDLMTLDPQIGKKISIKEIALDIKKLEDDLSKDINHCTSHNTAIFEKTRAQKDILRSQWTEYFNNNFTSILNTLSILRWVSMDDEMMSLVRNINAMGQKWPIDKADIEKLNYYKEKASKLIEKLDVNTDVQYFLRLIAIGNATLKDLTPEILKWLIENKFDSSIKLNFVTKQ